MTPDQSPSEEELNSLGVRLLEKITAVIFVLVLLALGWMVLAANWPQQLRLPTAEMEVIVVVTLLVLALGLVSMLALLHTR